MFEKAIVAPGISGASYCAPEARLPDPRESCRCVNPRAHQGPARHRSVLPNVQASGNGWHGKFRVVVPGFDVTCLVFSGAKIAYGSITSRNHKIPAQLSPLWRHCQEPLEDVTAGFVSPVHRRLEKDFSLCSYSQTHAHVCYSVWLALAGWVEGWPYTQLSSPWLF